MNKNKCWWCKEYGAVPLRVFTINGRQSITVRYCPLCGKEIKDEEEEQNENQKIN